jgi:hypothetical protein
LARAAAEAEDQRNAESSEGRKERNALQRLLAQRGLQIREIPPDGDCLFSALAHQCDLRQLGGNVCFLCKFVTPFLSQKVVFDF